MLRLENIYCSCTWSQYYWHRRRNRVGQIHSRPTRPKIRVGRVLHVLHGFWCV